MNCQSNAKLLVFSAFALLVSLPSASAQEGCCFEPTYRLQCETVLQPQTVQKYRLSYETEYVPQEVTSYRPAWKHGPNSVSTRLPNRLWKRATGKIRFGGSD